MSILCKDKRNDQFLGYNDPTANNAIANVDRERRKNDEKFKKNDRFSAQKSK